MVPKFRAWDKEENLWIKVASLVFDEEGEMWYLGPVMDDFNPVYYENELGKTWEIMQSTGLKDKNGVEIFEGDLVKKFSNINKFTDDFAEDIEPTYGTTSIVRDGACFKTTFKGEPSLVLNQNSISLVEHMEVVGNIYENPELLEQANEN